MHSSGPGGRWFKSTRPDPLLNGANNLQHRKVPTTSWLWAHKSMLQMHSPKGCHFLRQIELKWREAATTFSHFVAHVAQTGPASARGQLKPKPTFLAAFLTVLDGWLQNVCLLAA